MIANWGMTRLLTPHRSAGSTQNRLRVPLQLHRYRNPLYHAEHVRYRDHTAGILSYPPQLFDAINTWISGLMAAWAAARAKEMLVYYNEKLVGSNEDAYSVKRFTKKAQEYRELLRQTSLDGGTRRKFRRSASKQFRVDLKGLPSHYPSKPSRFRPKIKVSAIFTERPVPMSGTVGGTWHWEQQELTVYIHGNPPEDASQYRYALATMRTSVQHELRHAMQSILSSNLGLKGNPPTVGVPREIGSPGLQKPTKEEGYYLLPTEFFPWLGQSESQFFHDLRIRHLDDERSLDPDWKPNATLHQFNQFVGNPKPIKRKGFTLTSDIDTSPFFTALWKYDRERWKRAAKELWKMVSDHVRR